MSSTPGPPQPAGPARARRRRRRRRRRAPGRAAPQVGDRRPLL